MDVVEENEPFKWVFLLLPSPQSFLGLVTLLSYPAIYELVGNQDLPNKAEYSLREVPICIIVSNLLLTFPCYRSYLWRLIVKKQFDRKKKWYRKKETHLKTDLLTHGISVSELPANGIFDPGHLTVAISMGVNTTLALPKERDLAQITCVWMIFWWLIMSLVTPMLLSYWLG